MSDLPALEKLEQKAWAPSLQASAEVLRQRLERSFANFLCELDGEVVAVLYTQRIASVDAVDSQKFMEISASHDPHGAVLQLIAISADPDIAPQHMGLGSLVLADQAVVLFFFCQSRQSPQPEKNMVLSSFPR